MTDFAAAFERLHASGLINSAQIIKSDPLLTIIRFYGGRKVTYGAPPLAGYVGRESWSLEAQLYPNGSYFPFARGMFTPNDDPAEQFEAVVRANLAPGYEAQMIERIQALCGGAE